MLEVYLGIDACFSGAVQQVRDQGKRVMILLGDFVQTTEVNAETESAVFFLSKKDRAPYGDCVGLMNPVARCSSMNSRRATSSVCDREYICPSGGDEFSSRLIFRS